MVTRAVADAEEAAEVAARVVEMAALSAIRERGRFNLAVSGGKTPWRMLEHLSEGSVPWSQIALYQVDERVAPSGSPERNLTQLILSLPLSCQAAIRPMPVGADDLEAAAESYAYSLPEELDLVHLGLGADGHTASLVPGDPVLEVRDRDVAVTEGEYQGYRRMTLTYPPLDRARQVMFLVTGEEKHDALSALVAGDPTIPAGRVANSNTVLVTDLEGIS